MDSMNMDRVRRILQQHFPKTEWDISLPDDVQHRESYIAQKEGHVRVYLCSLLVCQNT